MKILSILSDHRFIGFDRMKVLLPDGCKIEMPTQSPFIKYSFPRSSIPIRATVRNVSYGRYFNTRFPSEVVVYIAK